MMPMQPVETLQDFVALVAQSEIRLMMGVVFTTPQHKNHKWYLTMGERYEHIKIANKMTKDSWGCLLGIYAYYLCPELLNAYQNAQTINDEELAFEQIELDFLNRFKLEFDKINPFRLWTWEEKKREEYFAAKTDKTRKKIACEYLLQRAIICNE